MLSAVRSRGLTPAVGLSGDKTFPARRWRAGSIANGEGSALHAERALVELQLAVDADLLVEIVPSVDDCLDGLPPCRVSPARNRAIASSSTTC